MEADLYQMHTRQTALYPKSAEGFIIDLLNSDADEHALFLYQKFMELLYVSEKLNGEAGEVAEHVGKALRDDGGIITEDRRLKLLKELGDVQWYVSEMATTLGFTLSEVMEANVQKLASRAERGVIHGSGDER